MSLESSSEPAVLRRALGRQLAAMRQAAEIGQQQVAHKTGYSRSSVAHAEAGRQLLTRDFWRTADELVKAEGALLAGYERVHTAKQEHERRNREAELVGAFAVAGGFRHDDTEPLQLSCSLPLPSSDAVVAASQEEWRAVRRHLIRHGTQLAQQAVRLYDPAWRITHTPALALPSWLPSRPVPIEAVTLEWVAHPPRPAVTGHEAELRPVLPLRSPGHAFREYTSAIRYLSPPSLFENRPSYRLLDVFWEPSGQGKLKFGLATFFDKLDVSEALSHEFTAAMMEGAPPTWRQLPFRARFPRPFDLSSRTCCTSIATLTLRRNTTDGSHTFFLLSRDAAKVVTGGGQYCVIPAGEFQPSCIAPACMQDDLDLWRNIVRECSEELLGEPEHDGSSGRPLDYECWPFYRAMERARESGRLRAHVLGVVVHALSLNVGIATVVVIDDAVFDDLFRDLVTVNAEGRVVTALGDDQSVHGLPFTEATVRQFLDRAPLGGTSAACLALTWRHRASLLCAR
ncbi:MAG: helix-turn-helix domain-containing protein [Pseudonocardiaceae bacterium]